MVLFEGKYYLHPEIYFGYLGYDTKVWVNDLTTDSRMANYINVQKANIGHNAFMTDKEKELLKKHKDKLEEILDIKCGCMEKGLTEHKIKGDDPNYFLYSGEVNPLMCRTINNLRELENSTTTKTVGDKAFRELYLKEDAKMRSENYTLDLGKHLYRTVINEQGKYVDEPFFYSPDFSFMQGSLIRILNTLNRGWHFVGNDSTNREMLLDLYGLYGMSNAVFGTQYAVPRIDDGLISLLATGYNREKVLDNPYLNYTYYNLMFFRTIKKG